jgi:amino acid transporter
MHIQSKREQRQLGLPAAIAVVTGEAIALGIFLTPAAMAKSLGSPLLLGLVWLGVALMAMCASPSRVESTSICAQVTAKKLLSYMDG